MNQQLVNIAIQELPAAIELIREAFVKRNPDLPVPTDEQVTSAYKQAIASSEAVDDRWLAAHPITT